MNAQDILNNITILDRLIRLIKYIPPNFADSIIHIIANYNMHRRKKNPHVQAMFANQWILHNGKISEENLEQIVRKTLINRLRFQYDCYHNLHSPEKMKQLVVFSPEVEAAIEKSKTLKRGAMLVGAHAGNFDLLGWALAQRIPNMQLITIANPSKSYQKENENRRKAGFDVTPASFKALQKASKRLKASGIVITANDRYYEDSKYVLEFCGRPTRLPTLYVRLALRANVPVIVLAAFLREDGKYLLKFSDPIWMEPNEDHDVEIVKNAEKVLKVTADFIRSAPDQWCMFYPIWPDANSSVPGLNL